MAVLCRAAGQPAPPQAPLPFSKELKSRSHRGSPPRAAQPFLTLVPLAQAILALGILMDRIFSTAY